MRYWLGAVLAVGLMGCDIQPVTDVGASKGTCPAEDFQYLKWQKQDVLDAVVLPRGTRIIGPNTVVTQDFRLDRLNFYIGNSGRIEVIRCG